MAKKFKISWGTPIGEPDWAEEVLIEGKTDLSNENILKMVKKKYGKTHNRFRVLVDDGKFPDFKKVFG